MDERPEGMLGRYRVLDLANEMGLLCGKVLGDLGADVIKIEKPGGDSARNLGPFYHDEPDPEKSLFWFAYNTSKRGITLDIETADGIEIFKKLVKTADFVIETFSPGYLDKLGLGYPALEKLNPRLILVSITPFGQSGPYRDYKAPDIVAWAMGGQMYICGEADRPPVRISHHSHAYLHAGAQAAVGALMALYQRQATGEGQWVDVSIHDACVRAATARIFTTWIAERKNTMRGVTWVGGGKVNVRSRWPCKDGTVFWNFFFGPQANRKNAPFLHWMEEEGMLTDFIKNFDWDKLDFNKISQGIVDELEEPIIKFYMSHTKAELNDGALKRNIDLYLVTTTKDILENTQLAVRGYWEKLEHPELGTSITYPGALALSSEVRLKMSGRAPLIGEHNQEIYEKELGITVNEMVILKQAGVI